MLRRRLFGHELRVDVARANPQRLLYLEGERFVAERSLVRPRLIVALGATAAESLTGSGKGILARRGRLEETTDGAPVFLTIHPSFLLRLRDRREKAEERARFEDELRTAVRHLERLRAA